MGRVLGILGSLALGLVLAGVGVVLNAWVLIYGGVVVFVLMAALWLYSWARPVKVPVPVHVPAPPAEPEPTDSKARAVWTLKKARDNASVSIKQGNSQTHERAYNEIVASLLTIKREFGFGPLSLTGTGSVPYPGLLRALINYMDRIIPLLREGHVDEARAVAAKFGWQWKYPEDGLDATLRTPRA